MLNKTWSRVAMCSGSHRRSAHTWSYRKNTPWTQSCPSNCRPEDHFWKPSTCSFRTIPSIISVFLNFLTTIHSKKNALYFNSGLPYKSIKKRYYSGLVSLVLLGALPIYSSPADEYGPHERLSCPPAKGGSGQWEAPAAEVGGRRGVGLGIF